MLPSFVRYTFRTTESAAEDRKRDKHERECIAIERHFVAAVLTTAGSMGCKPFLDWWNAIWRQASYQHVRPDVTAYDIYAAKQHTEASLHAVIVRHCAMATEYLKTPATPATVGGGSGADAAAAPQSDPPTSQVPRARGKGRGGARGRRGRGRGRALFV